MPALALGQSDLGGTWKIDLNRSQLPTETQVFPLQKPNIPVQELCADNQGKSDGTDQSVPGNLYFDTISLKVVDERTIEETRNDFRSFRLCSTILDARELRRRAFFLSNVRSVSFNCRHLSGQHCLCYENSTSINGWNNNGESD